MMLINFGQTKPAISGGKAFTRTALSALALTALLVQGCEQPRQAASSTRLYAIDQTGGAKTCNAPQAQPAGGQTTDVAMTVTNDGGWCGLSVSQSGRPYSAGLLTTRPKDGKVYVHVVGDHTRIDYTPDRGFAGNDSFVVKLVPGDASVRVNVAVAK
jgi:hypothetical protein